MNQMLLNFKLYFETLFKKNWFNLYLTIF